MSSTPVTAVLHHNLQDWTYVSGYEDRGSYNAHVSIVSRDGSGYNKNMYHKVLPTGLINITPFWFGPGNFEICANIFSIV